MAEPTMHLPAREVFRFGGALFLRILIAMLFGLALMKTGQALGLWPMNKAILIGEVATGLFLAISLFVKRIDWPEVDYGPDPEHSLLDDLDNDEAA